LRLAARRGPWRRPQAATRPFPARSPRPWRRPQAATRPRRRKPPKKPRAGLRRRRTARGKIKCRAAIRRGSRAAPNAAATCPTLSQGLGSRFAPSRGIAPAPPKASAPASRRPPVLLTCARASGGCAGRLVLGRLSQRSPPCASPPGGRQPLADRLNSRAASRR
jgi:hypothetical protein